KMELISVIVPVYKVEKYLNKCVESIVNQTYKNLEIILVDDGSPDNCPAMCDSWAEKDTRIKVVHKPNGGLSDARNAGMAVATGEYIAFVDSDDWAETDFIQRLYDSIIDNNSDISACGVKMVWEDNTESRNLTQNGDCVLDNTSAMEAVIKETAIKQPVWYKLYKSALIKNIPFPVGKYHEDVFWTYQAVARASTVSVFETPLYNYLQRGGSIMGEEYSLKRLDGIEAAGQRCEFINKNYPNLADVCQAQFVGMCMYNSQKLLISNIENKKQIVMQLCKQAKNIGNQWRKTQNIDKKTKMWNRLYCSCPKAICKMRNLLKIGV
ncbi:MAG: glycosyltransferase, partial [Clostridia bacterium]|nr:glycosyltransferase [Clostridia bacterium]